MTEQQKKRMEELVEVVNKHRVQYHVFDKPLISDKEYDALFYELVDLEKQTGVVLTTSPTLRVGADPVEKFEKVKHKQRLFSLDKAQTKAELEEWDNRNRKLQNFKQEYSVEYKFDGLAMAITFENGKFKQAVTRGNGQVGEDVTEQVKTIQSVPLEIKYQGLIEVQGEALMRLSVLKKYNKKATEPLKNARNGAAGAIRNLDPKVTASRHLDFIAYNVNYIEGKEFATQKEINEFLISNGFFVSDYFKIVRNIEEIEKEIKFVETNKKFLDFLIDGMVIKINSVHDRRELGFTDRFPRGMIAYKFEAEETSTMLISVDWQVGRTGKLTPVGNLEPVELAGVTVKRATLNNENDIQKKGIKLKSRVFVRRSNEVIPEVLGIAEEYSDSTEIISPTVCPACGAVLQKTEANLFCRNRKDCLPQIVSRITHFASKEGMNIDGLSDKTVQKMHEVLGVSDFHELYSLQESDLSKLESFKDKKISNLKEGIEKSKNPEFSNFLFALGIEGIGKKTASDLAKRFKTYENLKNATLDDLIAIEDIAEITATNIVEYFSNQENKIEIEKLFEQGVKIKAKHEKNLPLSKVKVVLTGTLTNRTRTEATKMFEDLGAEVQNSVTKSTNLVVVGENPGSKIAKAKQLGIEIVDEKEFEKRIAEAKSIVLE